MNSFLKQSTAAQDRSTPPFLDDTDFKTAETGLTIANTDVKLIKNGAASVDKNSGGGTHRANGCYGLTFNATDTDTVGELMVSIKVAGALPVFMKFWVLEEAIYDALFAASAAAFDANQRIDLGKWLGTAAATPTVAGVPEVDATHWRGDAVPATSVAGVPEVDVTHWVGVLVNALISGRVDANSQVVGDKTGYALTSAEKDAIARFVRTGTAQAGAAGTITLDAGASATDDLYNDLVVQIDGGTGVGQARLISDYVGATKVASVVPNWVTNPDATSTFVVRAATRMDLALWLGVAVNTLISGRPDVNTQVIGVDVITAAALSADAAAEIADKLLGRNIAGGSDGGRTVTSALRKIRNRVAIAAGTMTVYQEDDSSTDHTAAVLTTAGDPISSVDPA